MPHRETVAGEATRRSSVRSHRIQVHALNSIGRWFTLPWASFLPFSARRSFSEVTLQVLKLVVLGHNRSHRPSWVFCRQCRMFFWEPDRRLHMELPA